MWQAERERERYIDESFSYSKAFLCPVYSRYFYPRETLKFDSRDSSKIDLQGGRRLALMYKISAGSVWMDADMSWPLPDFIGFG